MCEDVIVHTVRKIAASVVWMRSRVDQGAFSMEVDLWDDDHAVQGHDTGQFVSCVHTLGGSLINEPTWAQCLVLLVFQCFV